MDDNDTSVGFFKEPGSERGKCAIRYNGIRISKQWYTDIKKDGCLSGKEKKILLKKISKKFCFKFIPFLRSGVRS